MARKRGVGALDDSGFGRQLTHRQPFLAQEKRGKLSHMLFVDELQVDEDESDRNSDVGWAPK
jgi:hypothetical protein